MICWLASFPKSGNTWLRSLISDYIFFSKEYSFENSIYKIQQFPNKRTFNFLLDEQIIKEENRNNFSDLNFSSNFWQSAQNRIIMSNQNDIFLKTHGVPCKIKNNFFVSTQTTKAAICVIRDPRQVALSLINHYNFDSQEQAFDFLKNNKLISPPYNKNDNKEIICNTPCPPWDVFYNSWIQCKKKFPVYIVRYEDMFEKENFIDLLKFINENLNVKNLKIDKTKADEVFERSKLKNLKKLETSAGFIEKLENNTKSFFNEGEISTWKQKLKQEIIDKIEAKFNILMKDFNYI